IERRDRLAKTTRDVFPTRRRKAHANVSIHFWNARLESTNGSVLHVPNEKALRAACVWTLLHLAKHRMAPERGLEACRHAKLDRGLTHGCSLRQQIGRIDADIARFVWKTPTFIHSLDGIACLELREIGMRLGCVGCAIGKNDASILLEDASTKNAHRISSKHH